MHRPVQITLNQRVKFTWHNTGVIDLGTVIDVSELDEGFVGVRMDDTIVVDPPVYRFKISELEVVE